METEENKALLEYSQDLKIDKNKLDTEWVQQSSKLFRYIMMCARAEYALSGLIRTVRDDISNNPEKYSISKLSEVAIQNVLECDESIRKARKLIRYLSGMSRAMEHRKKALEKLTELYLSGYWAKPRTSRNESIQRMEEMSEAATSEMIGSHLEKELGEDR